MDNSTINSGGERQNRDDEWPDDADEARLAAIEFLRGRSGNSGVSQRNLGRQAADARTYIDAREAGCEEEPPAPTNRRDRRRLNAVSARRCKDMGRDLELPKPKTRRKGRRQKKSKTVDVAAHNQRRRTKAAQRDAQTAKDQVAWVLEQGFGHDAKPCASIPNETFGWVRAISYDASGATGRTFLRRCPNKLLAGAAREVAFLPSPIDGAPNYYDWSDQRARDVIAVAALLYGMADPIKEVEHHRKRWGSCVNGLTRNMILKVLRPDVIDEVTGEPSARNRKGLTYLTGVYGWGGSWNTQPYEKGRDPLIPSQWRRGPGCGIITALEQRGALYRDPWSGQGYATTSGYQPNMYFLTSMTPEYGRDNADSAARMRLFDDELDAEYADILLRGEPGPHDVFRQGGPEPPVLTQH